MIDLDASTRNWRIGRAVAVGLIACLVLAGCQSMSARMAAQDDTPSTMATALAAPPPMPGAELGESAESGTLFNPLAGMFGGKPAKNLKVAKKHFREQNFGLAEKHYRRVVEQVPESTEGWVGLAASYNQLGRFDLADRAYEQAIRISGPLPEILNNQGYSQMLRGNRDRARQLLAEAQLKSPENLHVQGNLTLLEAARMARRLSLRVSRDRLRVPAVRRTGRLAPAGAQPSRVRPSVREPLWRAPACR